MFLSSVAKETNTTEARRHGEGLLISPYRRKLRGATRRLPLAIWLLLTGFYVLTMSGHTYSPDEETMYIVTREIVLHGKVAVPVTKDDAAVSALRPGRGGGSYASYGIVPSLLAVPLFAVGMLVGREGLTFDYATRFAVTALNAAATAATAAVLALWALRLGARRRVAVTVALLYGVATFAWPYARTFFSEPLAALFLLLAADRADAARQTAMPWCMTWAGVAAGLLVATRIASVVALPILVLFAVWPLGKGWLRWTIPAGVWWLLGLLPGLALVAGYNMLRFGTPFATGYGNEADTFRTPVWTGLGGLLLSPGKSVWLYAPPALLAIPGALLLWRQQRTVVLLAWGLFAAHVLLYARWSAWDGGAWGPRFLLTPLPLLFVLMVGALGHVDDQGSRFAQRLRRVSRIVAMPLAGLGLIGALGGMLVNFDTYLNMQGDHDRIYSWAGSPLVVHWRMLGGQLARHFPADDSCTLRDGWFASEQLPASLPRRSGANGTLQCDVGQLAQLTLTLDDRRPPAAPASNLVLRLNNVVVQPPAGQARGYHLLLPLGDTTLRLESTTWNPRAINFSERDDELGVAITGIGVRVIGGAVLPVRDAAVAPLSHQPRPRWAWYYEPTNQHLVDHWAWYLPRSELGAGKATIVAVLVCGIGGGLMFGGVYLLQTIRRNQNA